MIRKLMFFSVTRSVLLFSGLAVVSAGVLLITAASQTRLLVAQQSLNQYWRTTYDILIRPAGTRAPVEEKYGLVEANHISGIWGGITFDQYEAIKSIPGVEVAAPIAMIGYIPGEVFPGNIKFPPDPGLYLLEETTTVNDGDQQYLPPDYPRFSYYFFDRDPQKLPADPESTYRKIGDISLDWPDTSIGGSIQFPFLIAGIDPLQEAALVGLDKTVVSGNYLQGNDSLAPTVSTTISLGKPVINLPILINLNNYVNLTHRSTLKRVLLPPDMLTVDQILKMGGASYLKGLPAKTLATVDTDSRTIYQQMIEAIAPHLVGISMSSGPPVIIGVGGMENSPGPIVYKQSDIRPKDYSGIVLDLVPPENQPGNTWPEYRASTGPVEFQSIFMWDPKGIFDIERLPRQADVNRLPLETYFPPIAILKYDDRGNSLNPPVTLNPTLSTAGYLISPPMVLTTLDAARAIRGDAPISAIRVRVALEGCPGSQLIACTITPSDQRKIETVAIEIQRRTGLIVDIMVGSSPKRILVHLPGKGYVEEQWIQKGVDLTYKQGVQSGNWLLVVMLWVAGALFILNLTWTEIVARRRIIALQKALGWRSRDVFIQILGQVLLIGAAAFLIGTLGAMGLTQLLKWKWPPGWLLVALPLVIFGMTVLGSLIPAWSASRTPPVSEFQSGGIHYRRKGERLGLGLWSYAWNTISRKPGRTLLAGLAAIISAFLLVLFLAVMYNQQGLLSGTLLGEFILVHIEGYHYAIVIIGLGLAALSTANGLLASIIERQREIAVLKAVGWRTREVERLFVLEGLLLGLAGGTIGALLGSLTFAYTYHSISPDLLIAIFAGVGVPGLVGAMAALYPAHRAAQILPADAVRYE